MSLNVMLDGFGGGLRAFANLGMSRDVELGGSSGSCAYPSSGPATILAVFAIVYI